MEKKRFFNFKNLFLISFLAVAGIFSAGAFVVNKQAQEAPVMEKVEAANSDTVYFAISASDISSAGANKVRCKYRDGGNGNDPEYTVDASDTGNTYYGKSIYKFTFSESYGGVGHLQFELWNGGSWVSNPDQPINDYTWTTRGTYNGKMWVHSESGWKTYSYDSTSLSFYLDTTNWTSMGSTIPEIQFWDIGGTSSYSLVSGTSVTSVSGGGTYSNKVFWKFTIKVYTTTNLGLLFRYGNYTNQTGDINYTANNYGYKVSGTKGAAPVQSFASANTLYKIDKYTKKGTQSAELFGTDYVLSGENYTVPALPGNKDGYTRVSTWNTDSSGTGTSYNPGASINSVAANKTLYARYTPNNYGVTISSGTGISSVYLSSSSTATSGSVSGTEFPMDSTVYGFAVLKAGYKSQANWELVSGTADTEGAKYRIGSGTVTTSGYDFESVSATAQTYTIDVDLDGGSGQNDTEYTFSDTAQTIELDTPTKSGYSFNGYTVTTQPTGGDVTVSNKTTLNIPANAYGNIAVKAQWAETLYTVTLYKYNNVDGGTITPSVITVAPGTTFTNKDVYTLEFSDGQVVKVAPYAATAEFRYSSLGFIPAEGTVASDNCRIGVAFRIYRNSYTITLDTSGGSYSVSNIYENYNEGYYLDSGCSTNKMTTDANPISPLPTRDGYDFGGYYTGSDGTGTQYIDENGYLTSNASTTQFSSAGTLYVKWIAHTTEVTLNKQEGSGGTNSVTATFGSAMPTIAVPTRTGYDFGGYFTETGGAGTKYYNADGTSAKNWTLDYQTRTLYAYWIINTYTITYDRNQGEGSSEATQPKNYGQDVNALTPGTGDLSGTAWDPSQYHYFSHWNTHYDDTGDTVNAGSAITSNVDFKLYYIEKWYEYRYTINGGSPVYMTSDSAAGGAIRQFAPASAQELPLHGILNFQVNRHDGNGWVDISVNYESGSNYNTTTGIQLATNDTIYLKLCENEAYNVWVPGISDRTIKITNTSGSVSYTMKGNGDNECVTVGYVYAKVGDTLEAEYLGGGAYKVWLDDGSTGFKNSGATWQTSTGVVCTEAGAYTVYLKKGSGEWHNVWISRNEEASAKHFAQIFNSSVGAICTGIQAGTKDLSDLQSVWGATSSVGLYKEYSEYSAATKAYFTGASSTSDADILACIEKYNYVVGIYGTSNLPNFMERSVPSNAIRNFTPFGLLNGGDGNNITTVIVIVSSAVALLSITALSMLIVKKRKRK